MTLADTLDHYEAGQPMASRPFVPSVMRRRAYMAGALDALVLLNKGATAEQLLAECRQFGRAIGTAAEAAQLSTTPEPRT